MNELLLVPAPFGVWGKGCLSGKVSPGPLREAKTGKTSFSPLQSTTLAGGLVRMVQCSRNPRNLHLIFKMLYSPPRCPDASVEFCYSLLPQYHVRSVRGFSVRVFAC